MRIRRYLPLIAIVVLGFATIAIAARKGSVTAKFDRPVKIAGKTLPRGTYEFEVSTGDPSVTVVRRYEAIAYPELGQGPSWESKTEIVATIHGKWVKLGFKARKTQVRLSADHVWEIEFRGESRAVSFSK